MTGNFSDDEYNLEDLAVNLNQHLEVVPYTGPHVYTAVLIDVDTNNSADASESFIVEKIIVKISGEVQQNIDDKSEKIEESNSAQGYLTCCSKNDLEDLIDVLPKPFGMTKN